MNPQEMVLFYIQAEHSLMLSKKRKSFQEHLTLMETNWMYRWFTENTTKTYLPTHLVYSGVGPLWIPDKIQIIVEQ
jgi:hypothetical protein